MKAIQFDQQTQILAEEQDEYFNLPIHFNDTSINGEATAIFELSDEEIEVLVKTRKIYLGQYTFGKGYSPIILSVYKQDTAIPMIGKDWFDLMIDEYKGMFLIDSCKRWNETIQSIHNTVLKNEFPTFKDFILDGLGIRNPNQVIDTDWSRGVLWWDNISNLQFKKV